jgi:hypothetical protein
MKRSVYLVRRKLALLHLGQDAPRRAVESLIKARSQEPGKG